MAVCGRNLLTYKSFVDFRGLLSRRVIFTKKAGFEDNCEKVLACVGKCVILWRNTKYTIMDKTNRIPIVWLKVTEYMHGWMQHELGGALTVKGLRVLCANHLPGAREVLRMETEEDCLGPRKIDNVMSDNRKNCVSAGLTLDQNVVKQLYGLTKDKVKLFLPLECPRVCMTKSGVLRSWSLDVSLGRKQALAMQDLLRKAFWHAVELYNRDYAVKKGGSRYTAEEMIEDFCAETDTPDLYVDEIRREWQRRVKRGDVAMVHVAKKAPSHEGILSLI